MAAGGDRTELVGLDRLPVSLPSLQTRTGSDVTPRENTNESVTSVNSGSNFPGGNEFEDENLLNVARWLASLPKDRHWCEAEEQIACMEDYEGPNFNESIFAGDGEYSVIEAAPPIAEKLIQHRRGKPRIANVELPTISIDRSTIERRKIFPIVEKLRSIVNPGSIGEKFRAR